MRRKYFCGCGEPIEKEELMCADCEWYWDNKYKDDTHFTENVTDEIRERYMKE